MTDCTCGEICMRRNSRNRICLGRSNGYAASVLFSQHEFRDFRGILPSIVDRPQLIFGLLMVQKEPILFKAET